MGYVPIYGAMSADFGCYVPHTLREPLRGARSGALAGRTFALKDLYDVAGRKTGNGSPDFLAWTAPAREHAAAVRRLLDAGAACVGIAVCDEFFYSLTGINAHYGAPRNVRAPGRMPGGSSSGCAAAVAAELCDFALGSDTGGSVRIPAAFCGTWGIRPTHGRVDLAGARAMAPSYDTAGWFAADARLLRAVGDVLLEGRAARAKPSRLLIAEDAFGRADPAVRRALERVLERAAAVLPRPETVTLSGPAGDLDAWREAFRVLQGGEIRHTNLPWVREHRAALGPGIRERFAMAEALTPGEIAEAGALRARVRERLLALVPEGTLLCLPSAPVIAPRLEEPPAALESFRANTMALTCIAGHAGLPQLSVPAAEVEGCPVGLSFIAWPGGDEALLALGEALSPYRSP